MANYNYTPSDQVAIQQKMSEELMNQDMRQGLGRGQKTDWGRGLAHMLRQYQGGQMSRDATAKSEANEKLRSQDNALMAELLVNPEGQAAPDFASMEIAKGLDPSMVQGAQDQAVGLPSMSQAQFSTPQGQQMQLGQIGQLNSERRAQSASDTNAQRDHNYALELQGVKNQGRAGGGGSDYFSPVYTAEGVRAFDHRGGTMGDVQGQGSETPILRTSDDPTVQAALTDAKVRTKGEVEKDQSFGAAQARTDSMMASSQGLIDITEELLGSGMKEGLDTATGLSGYIHPANIWPGSKTTDAKAKMNQLKDKIFVKSLSDMRAMSKSGGAVGNVSDKEGDRMENQMIALNAAQSDDQYRKELEKLVEITREGQARIQNALRLEYGDRVGGTGDLGSMSDEDLFK